MTTYSLLIYRVAPPSDPIPAEEEKQVFAGHRKLQGESSKRGQLHAVARLDEPGTARTVRKGAGGHEISDGPYIESKEWLVGFYLVDCDNEAQALDRAKQICPDRHHVVEARPVNWKWRQGGKTA
jgi:hypothetical protein